jgi:hypothetical protein
MVRLTLPSIHQEDKKIDATVGKTWIRNTFTNPVTMSVTTLSIKDVYYPIVPDTAFHPINTMAAIKRIRSDYFDKIQSLFPQQPVTMELILMKILDSPRAQATWATVFEYRDEPFYVVRNLAHTNTTLPYRRILVVKLDLLVRQDPLVRQDAFVTPYPMRTWDQVRSSLMHEEFYPLTSMTM